MNWDLVLRSPSLDSARILQSLKTISSQITVKEWALVQPSEQTIYVASRMRDLEQTEAEIRRAYPFVSKVEWFRGERTIERIDDVLPTEVDSAMMQNIQRIRGTDHQGQPYGLN